MTLTLYLVGLNPPHYLIRLHIGLILLLYLIKLHTANTFYIIFVNPSFVNQLIITSKLNFNNRSPIGYKGLIKTGFLNTSQQVTQLKLGHYFTINRRTLTKYLLQLHQDE